MTTDYKNLTLFEAAAVFMIAVGIVLISIQIFAALPNEAQAKVVQALGVFEMSEPIADAWAVHVAVNDYVFKSFEVVMDEMYVAVGEVALPVAEQVEETAQTYASIARSLAEFSDTIALNYQNNYVSSGVEASMGGRVMGAFIERLDE